MFIVRIILTLRATHRGAFQEFVRSEGLKIRQLSGCIDYSFLEDVSDPARVLLYEEWSSRGQFEAYKASASFEAVGGRLRPMLAGPPQSAYYESDDVFASCAVR